MLFLKHILYDFQKDCSLPLSCKSHVAKYWEIVYLTSLIVTTTQYYNQVHNILDKAATQKKQKTPAFELVFIWTYCTFIWIINYYPCKLCNYRINLSSVLSQVWTLHFLLISLILLRHLHHTSTSLCLRLFLLPSHTDETWEKENEKKKEEKELWYSANL